MTEVQIPKELEKFKEQLLSTEAVTNEITLKAQKTQPWESKLGGCPYLHSKEEYPLGANGKPMLFFAQINLEEVKGIEELPKTGILQFFVEDDGTYGYGIQSDILVRLVEYDQQEVLQEHPYADEEYLDQLPFDKEGRMTFTCKKMLISSTLESFEEMFKEADEEEQDNLNDLCYTCDCRIGGYPYFVQGDFGFDIKEDFLLLQLDVEDECGIMFGDAGNCNFFISREDLKKRDFSKAWYDWQCC